MEPEAILDFHVPPEPRASRAVRERVMQQARAHGVPEEDIDLFVTALGEAIANAVEHGGERGAGFSIKVEIRIAGNRIVGTVQDNGCGFEPDSISEPALPDAHSERGRGLPIIRRCSDFFAVNSTPGKGTAVLLGRYFHPSAGRRAA